MSETNGYKHLAPKPGYYRQLHVKGRNIRADVLYGYTLGEDARTAEELARDYRLPLEVVEEAIDYCKRNPDVLQQDRERELARARVRIDTSSDSPTGLRIRLMNLYLDDNIADDHLANLLVKGGHLAIQPVDVGMDGKSDARHFEYAMRNLRILLTKDRDDFQDLHNLILASGGSHPGVLVIRYEKDSTKDMKPKHIVTAISKLAKSGLACTGSYIILNHWR